MEARAFENKFPQVKFIWNEKIRKVLQKPIIKKHYKVWGDYILS